MRGKKFFIGLRAILAIFAVSLLATSTWAASEEKVLHNFGSGTDGRSPYSNLIFDAAGNLYGTTFWGGTYDCPGGNRCGTVFELTPAAGGDWTEQVLHNFNGTDGATPAAGLVSDVAGNLYGTTSSGGTYGYGTVFELTPAAGEGWTEQVLHRFNSTDGDGPVAGLLFDAAGNLYGTTSSGGTYGYGTVFELTPAADGSWAEKVLHSFAGYPTDGNFPNSGLIFDTVGNLYGTTPYGGANDCVDYGYPSGCGMVFELTPTLGGVWTEQVLYNFNNNGTDGHYPDAGLIFDAAGNLYGTTDRGGGADTCIGGCGTVFELTRSPHSPNAVGRRWTEQVLHTFNADTADGANPVASLIFDAAGNLYGTTLAGGPYDCVEGFGCGTVFELTPAAGGGWTEQVLYNFAGYPTDGSWPYAGLIFDAVGNLYSTTNAGGDYNAGTVFEITP